MEILRRMSWSCWLEKEDRRFLQVKGEEEQNGVQYYDEAILDIWKQQLQARTSTLNLESTSTLINEYDQGGDSICPVVLDRMLNLYELKPVSRTISFTEF